MHKKILYFWKMVLDARCKFVIENHYAKVYFDFYVRKHFNVFLRQLHNTKIQIYKKLNQGLICYLIIKNDIS